MKSLKNSTRIINLDTTMEPHRSISKICCSFDLQYFYLISQDGGDIHVYKAHEKELMESSNFKQEHLIKLDIEESLSNPMIKTQMNPNKNQICLFKENGNLVVLKS